MNTRLLAPIAVFVLWSALCWRWYVCGIKERCDDTAAPPVTTGQAISFPVETYVQQNAIEPDSTLLAVPMPHFLPQLPSLPQGAGVNTGEVSFSELPDQVLIHFPYNSIRKQDDAAVEEYLSRLADYLKFTGQRITITGHTDNVGDPKTNYRLGLQRAQAIRKTLVSKGVPAEKITCLSKGEKEPIATNDNPRGRYQNRRVEIRITP
ncbi:MAG: OmpA family protein [Saprospiraceae bacterium]|nr:OmpA family protein [Saprospiraceae bacterium]MDW8230826.1 OmpA family protein [Saprospiraceae bacterium]